MRVGDLVRHTGWQEKGLVVKVLRDRATASVYEVQGLGRVHRSQWVGRDMEVISERR